MSRPAKIFWLALSSLLFTCLLQACGAESSDLRTVKIFSPSEKLRASYAVEIADEPAEIAHGLMYRQELPADRGMLFIFSELNSNPFWMKNTLIPLDMVFISADKKIISIVVNAAPQTTTPRFAEAPYQYVLEINGGQSSQLGISPGDRVEF